MVKNILSRIPFNKAVVVYDERCDLAKVLTDLYRVNLPNADFINFDEANLDELRTKLYALSKDSLVVLVQSNSFRISSYRIRLDLNNRGIFVVDHARLQYIKTEEHATYLASLDFVDDGRANRLIELLSKSKEFCVVSSDGSELVYEGPFEPALSNVGDFFKSKGSYFPVGEVFTELVDLTKVNGECLVFGVPVEHRTRFVEPFKIVIRGGCVVSHSGPKEFDDLINLVKTENPDGKVWLREMGFGLNTFITKETPLFDITSCERMAGFHLSLGLKHGVFRKKMSNFNQRFHIDCFVDVTEFIFS